MNKNIEHFISNLSHEDRQHLKKDLHLLINGAKILSHRFKEGNISDLQYLDHMLMANKKIFNNAKKIVHLLNHVGITIDHFKAIHNNEEREEQFHEVMEKVHGLLEHSHALGLDHIGVDAKHIVVEAYNAAVADKNLKDKQDLEKAESAFIRELVLELGELVGIEKHKLNALRNNKGLLKELVIEFAHLVRIKKEKLLALKEKAKHVFVDLQHIVENKKGAQQLRETDINEHTRTKAIRRCMLIISEVIFIGKIAHYDFHSHGHHDHHEYYGHGHHGHHYGHGHHSHGHHGHHYGHGHHDHHSHGRHGHHSHAESFFNIAEGDNH